MEIESRMPEWVGKWLKLPFYDGEKCAKHRKFYKTVYCTACMEDPICNKCSIKHTCDHRQMLKARRASEREAIEVTEIRNFLDISEIQLYSINRLTIVHINPDLGISSIAKHKPYCHTCRRKFMKPSKYKFCSIACKVEKEGRAMVIERECDGPTYENWSLSSDIEFAAEDEVIGGRLATTIKVEINSANIMINTNQCSSSSSSSSFSYRKRTRKGIPRRAPLK